ncbi:hypothetical protein D3C75_862890 [compost metagenome]
MLLRDDDLRQTELQRLLRVHRTGAKDQLLGLGQPDEARQYVQHRQVRHQAQTEERGHQAYPWRHEHEVRGQGQGKAGTHRRAVNRRDHRFLQVDQTSEPFMKAQHQLAPGERAVFALLQAAQVETGAE